MKTMTLDDVRKLPPLTAEEVAEVKNFKNMDFEDCPKLTKEQLAEFRPAHPENFVKEKRQKVKARAIDLSDIRELTEEDFSRGHFRNKVEVKIMMEAGLLEKFNATGLDLESYINSSVRTAVAEYGA